MRCKHFGECGGCSLSLDYEEQLALKVKNFASLGIGENPQVFKSPISAFRARAEFRIYRDEKGLHFAMFSSKKPIIIDECQILLPHLQVILKKLKSFINEDLEFSLKLFGVEVLGTLQGEALITLLYHRPLDEQWSKKAKLLSCILDCCIIGRSRSQKIVLQEEKLKDCVSLGERDYYFVRYDNSFSQPNPYMNIKMLEFALSCVGDNAKDLLELYCGGGNFTIPLSRKFRKVFATEVAKTSIKALKENLILNQVENVICARLSGAESIEALSFQRDFFRLREINLLDYRFSHLLVDPPRSGIGDKAMLEFMQRFDEIIYISCNPLSLKEDLKILAQTHTIQSLALFDQFPYTHHLECGIGLTKIQ